MPVNSWLLESAPTERPASHSGRERASYEAWVPQIDLGPLSRCPDGGLKSSKLPGGKNADPALDLDADPATTRGRNQKPSMTTDFTDTILRLPQVKEVTGLGRSTLYLYIQRGWFPKQCRLGERAVGWRSSEVFRWVAERETRQ